MLIPLTPHTYFTQENRTVIELARAEGLDRQALTARAVRHFDNYSGCIPDETLRIIKTVTGKPEFASYPAHLSISHSGDYFALAISSRPVGIDLQEHRPVEAEKLAHRFFHPEEEAYVLAGGEFDKVMRFYRIWTAKEAYVKMTGTGIDGQFSKFSVLSLPQPISWIHMEEGYTLSVCGNTLLPLLF